MPVYEYHCNTCGNNFEATQRMSDAPLTSCACGASGAVTRLLSAGSGLIFKGSGFYITDYKNNGSGSAASPAAATTSTESSTATAAPAAPTAPAPAAKPAGTSGSGGCGSC